MIQNAEGIAKLNFKMAMLDVMPINPFEVSDIQYDLIETELDRVVTGKIATMQDSDIQAIALAVVSGNEIGYNEQLDEFFII